MINGDLDIESTCGKCQFFMDISAMKRIIDSEGNTLEFYLGLCDNIQSDHYAHIITDIHSSCGFRADRRRPPVKDILVSISPKLFAARPPDVPQETKGGE